MCDTMVVTAEASADGVVLFAKNTDRAPNEAHHVVVVPAADHPSGSRLACTYIEIPQVEHTNAVLLAKPFWIWGAEMGANEHNVAIGNEALFTKIPFERQPGLIGMDLLRLALERAATARAAVTVITELLATYGQGGNCGFGTTRAYHNSFLIADPQDAWVLETAGREWAARQVRGVYAISNRITIGRDYDVASPNLVTEAVQRGWCKGKDDFDFGRCYSDFTYSHFRAASDRRACALQELSAHGAQNTVVTLMHALRSHGRVPPGWQPDGGVTVATVCMHASFGPVRGSQTTGAMVSHLHAQAPTHFVTATAAPCTSIFKPVWLDAALPDTGPMPAGTFNAASLYWQHERLHRAVLRDYAARLAAYAPERDRLEAETTAQALAAATQAPAARAALSARCFADAAAAEERWLAQVSVMPIARGQSWLHKRAWRVLNEQSQMPV